jgi:aminotransferase EvaB
MVNMDKVNAIAVKYALSVLEDCAQSHGAEYNGKKAGSLSTLAAFSFYPTKVLGGYGDGGMVITNDEKMYKKLLRLRFYGMEKEYYAHEHGYNSRLDELHAAILLKKLSHLDDYIARRRAIADRYDAMLSDSPLILPHRDTRCKHVFYLYVCRHKKRDEIIAKLAKEKIFLNVSYPWPVHTMEAYRYFGYSVGSFPCTEAAVKEIFSLPMYPSLEEKEQFQVINALKGFLEC